jgi:hypothetical protein
MWGTMRFEFPDSLAVREGPRSTLFRFLIERLKPAHGEIVIPIVI